MSLSAASLALHWPAARGVGSFVSEDFANFMIENKEYFPTNVSTTQLSLLQGSVQHDYQAWTSIMLLSAASVGSSAGTAKVVDTLADCGPHLLGWQDSESQLTKQRLQPLSGQHKETHERTRRLKGGASYGLFRWVRS